MEIVQPLRWDSGREDDLQPLLRALRGVELLQLGEATHGGGEFYRLKARLIPFLQRKAGFSTLLFEAGFLETTLAGLDRPRLPARRLLEDTLFPNYCWQEVLPLFEWLTTQARFGFFGIDPQFSADGVLARVESLITPYNPDLAKDLRSHIADGYGLYSLTADSAAYAARRKAYLEWLAAARKRVAALTPRRDDRVRLAVVQRALEVLPTYWDYTPERLFGPERNQDRDRLMAEQAEWVWSNLARKSRVILWAHNGHIGQVPWYRTTGQQLQTKRGKRSYALGLFALEGSFYLHTTRRVEPWVAPKDGLEQTLFANHSSPAVFVDFRSLAPEARAPFLRPLSAFEPENGGSFAFTPAERFDGVIVVRKLTPPTKLV